MDIRKLMIHAFQHRNLRDFAGESERTNVATGNDSGGVPLDEKKYGKHARAGEHVRGPRHRSRHDLGQPFAVDIRPRTRNSAHPT